MTQPFEARQLDLEPTPEILEAMGDLCTAVSGFYHPGDHADALFWGVAWLRTQPEICEKLGLR